MFVPEKEGKNIILWKLHGVLHQIGRYKSLYFMDYDINSENILF